MKFKIKISLFILVLLIFNIFKYDAFAYTRSGSVNIEANVNLVSPTNLTASNRDDGSVFLQWSKETNLYNVDYFKLYYKKSSESNFNNFVTLYVDSSSIYTSTVLTDLDYNVSYDFLIRAFNNQNQGTDTSCILRSCKITGFLVIDYVHPQPITNLVVLNTGADNIVLKWDKSISSDVAKQYLYVYTGSTFGDSSIYAILNKDVSSIKVSNLNSNTIYNFAFVVEDKAGNKSNIITVSDKTSDEDNNLNSNINSANALFIVNQSTSTTILDNIISVDNRLNTVVANILSDNILPLSSFNLILTSISPNNSSGIDAFIPAGTNVVNVNIETLNSLSGAIYTWDGIINAPKEISPTQLIFTGSSLSNDNTTLGVDYLITKLDVQYVDKAISVGSDNTGVSIVFDNDVSMTIPVSSIYSGHYVSIYYNNNNGIWKFLDNGNTSTGVINGSIVQFSSDTNIANDGIPDLFKVYYDPLNINVPYYTKFKTNHFTQFAAVPSIFSPVSDKNTYDIGSDFIRFKWYFQSSMLDQNNNVIYSADYTESRFICDNCANKNWHIIPKSQGNSIYLSGLSSNTTYNGRIKFCNDYICSKEIFVSAKTNNINNINGINNLNSINGGMYKMYKYEYKVDDSNKQNQNNNQINFLSSDDTFYDNNTNDNNLNNDVQIDNNINSGEQSDNNINIKKQFNDSNYDIKSYNNNENLYKQDQENIFKLFNFDDNIMANGKLPFLIGHYLPNETLELVIFDKYNNIFSVFTTKCDSKGLFIFLPRLSLPDDGIYKFIFRSGDKKNISKYYNIFSTKKHVPNVNILAVIENANKPKVHGKGISGYILKGVWVGDNDVQYFTKKIDDINGDFVLQPEKRLLAGENKLYLYQTDDLGFVSEFSSVSFIIHSKYTFNNVVEEKLFTGNDSVFTLNNIDDRNEISNNDNNTESNLTNISNSWMFSNIFGAIPFGGISGNFLVDIFVLFIVIVLIFIYKSNLLSIFKMKSNNQRFFKIVPSKNISKYLKFKIRLKNIYNVITRIFS